MVVTFKSPGTYVVIGRRGEIARETRLTDAKDAASGDSKIKVRWRSWQQAEGGRKTWYSDGDYRIELHEEQ